jgi:hypothetical protein
LGSWRDVGRDDHAKNIGLSRKDVAAQLRDSIPQVPWLSVRFNLADEQVRPSVRMNSEAEVSALFGDGLALHAVYERNVPEQALEPLLGLSFKFHWIMAFQHPLKIADTVKLCNCYFTMSASFNDC